MNRHVCRHEHRSVHNHVNRHVYRYVHRYVNRHVCRHVHNFMHRHGCRHVCRHGWRHVHGHVYRHVCRHVHGHVYGYVYGNTCILACTRVRMHPVIIEAHTAVEKRTNTQQLMCYYLICRYVATVFSEDPAGKHATSDSPTDAASGFFTCVRACIRACMRACVRAACVRACMVSTGCACDQQQAPTAHATKRLGG